ncbi:hypothetical protein ABET52_12640 [Saccharococcus caldoxylosilyticus]|uniref:hypothetical protein n=1 Tax=Saccharococcus caldoxylosilyticus TaxID=81408 RepID=UPI003D32B0F1
MAEEGYPPKLDKEEKRRRHEQLSKRNVLRLRKCLHFKGEGYFAKESYPPKLDKEEKRRRQTQQEKRARSTFFTKGGDSSGLQIACS